MTGSFQDLAADAPDLAALVRDRFESHLHHVLGTIRPDGSPRLSGTEVRFADGQVTLGMMAGSAKLADVLRDPRVELHSAPVETDLARGDARLHGVLERLGDIDEGDEPPGTMLRLALDRVVLVQVAGDELVVSTWRPGRGVQVVRRR